MRGEEGGGFVVVGVVVGVFGGFAFAGLGCCCGALVVSGGGAGGGGVGWFQVAFDALVFLARWGVLVGRSECWKGCGG